MNSWDHYLLLDGTPGFGGFENVGRDDNPKPELSLSKFNSYDEMRLAALVSLSTMAPLVNDGGKNNCGVIGNGVTHELDGAILGQVGARFEKEGYMDWVDCIVKRNQNTEENGYGKGNKHPKSKFLQAWANVWGLDHLPLFEDVKLNPENYEYIHVKDAYLNKRVYKARIQMLAEVMLIEASNRAKTANRKAYVHVSGLGLSAWMISQIQTRLFIESWADAIHHMPLNVTDNIACINFSCIPTTRIQGVKSGDKFPSTDITIRFTKRDMLERVPRGCLLVCNYSADSNSYPGNVIH